MGNTLSACGDTDRGGGDAYPRLAKRDRNEGMNKRMKKMAGWRDSDTKSRRRMMHRQGSSVRMLGPAKGLRRTHSFRPMVEDEYVIVKKRPVGRVGGSSRPGSPSGDSLSGRSPTQRLRSSAEGDAVGWETRAGYYSVAAVIQVNNLHSNVVVRYPSGSEGIVLESELFRMKGRALHVLGLSMQIDPDTGICSSVHEVLNDGTDVDNSHDRDLQFAFLVALPCICTGDPEAQAAAVARGAVERVLGAMSNQHYFLDLPLQAAGMSALGCLARDSAENLARVLDEGGLEVVLSLLDRCKNDATIVACACYALGHLCSRHDVDGESGGESKAGGGGRGGGREGRSLLARGLGGGAGEQALRDAKRARGSESVLEAIRHCSPGVMKSFGAGGMRPAAATLSPGGRSVALETMDNGLLASGCKALALMAVGGGGTGDQEHQDAILRGGAVDLALEAMDTFPGDESMQKAGCWLLGAVAIEHLEGHRMVLTAGGLRAVLEMMRRFGNSVDSQVTGCFALTSLGLLHNKASGVPERYVGAILV
jgi:hypothetical protein